MAEKEPEPCHICGTPYRVPYLYQHLRKAHGIYGGATGTVRDDRRSKRKKKAVKAELVPVVAPPEPVIVPEWEELGNGYKLLRHIDGDFYVAQRIRFGER